MRQRKRQLLGLLIAQAMMLFTSSAIATVVMGTGHGGRFVSGGSDGVGGIPYANGPQSPSDISVPYLLTIGLVIDGAEMSVPSASVVVMSSEGTVVGFGMTDESGVFAVDLPATHGLTVSLPLHGVLDYPIEAGTPVLIVVP